MPPVTTQTRRATRSAAAFVALLGAHGFADYWAQTHHQAMDKGRSGDAHENPAGRAVALSHIAIAMCTASSVAAISAVSRISISARAGKES